MSEEPDRTGEDSPRVAAPWTPLLDRALHVDADGHILHESRDDAPTDTPSATVSLADLLPEQTASRLIAAINAAARTGRVQILEFDVLAEDGPRRIHAEASVDPAADDRFLLLSREVAPPADGWPDAAGPATVAAALAAASQAEADPKAVYRQLAAGLPGLVPFDSLTVTTVHPARDCQYVEFSTAVEQGAALPLEGSVVEVVLRTGVGLKVPGGQTGGPTAAAGRQAAAVIVVPLRWAEEIAGFLAVQAPPGVEYSDADLTAVEAVTAPVAATLASHLVRAGRDRERAAEAIIDAVSAVARTAGDVATVAEVAVDQLHRFPGFARVLLELTDAGDTGPAVSAARGLAPPASVSNPASLALPIGPPRATRGSLVAHTADPRGFDDCACRLLERVAQRIDGALHRIASLSESASAARELRALSAISAALAEATDTGTLLQAAADAIQELARPDRLCVTLVEPDRASLRRVVVRGTAIPDAGEGSRIALPARAMRPEIVRASPPGTGPPDDVIEPGADGAGLQAHMQAPLLARGRLLGAITLHASDADAYSQPDLDRMQRIAAQIAPGIAHLQLARVVEAHTGERDCLRALEVALTDARELESVVSATHEAIRERVPATRVSIATFDRERETITEAAISGAKVPGWTAGAPRPTAGTPEHAAVTGPDPVVSGHESPDALIAAFPGEAPALAAGLRWVAALPLIAAGEAFGCLTLRGAEAHALPDHDASFLRRVAALLAGHAAAAELREARDRQRIAQAGLDDIGRLGSDPPDPPELYSFFAERLCRLIPFDHLEVTLLGEDPDILIREFQVGVAVPGWDAPARLPLAGAVAETVIRSRSSVLVGAAEDMDLVFRFPAHAAGLAAGLRSLLAAPLFVSGRSAGCLTLRRVSPGAFSSADAALLKTATIHLSTALASARLRQETRRSLREHEAVAAAGFAAASEPDLKAACERVAERLTCLVPCDRLTVTVVSPDADGVRIVHEHGMPAPQPAVAAPLDRPGAGRPEWEDMPFRSVLRARIGAGSQPLGYLALYALREDAFTESDADLSDRMADQLAAAVEREQSAASASQFAAERDLRERLHQQNLELRQQTRARDTFLQTVTHELKSPLTTVYTHTQLLLQDPRARFTAPQRSHLAEVERGAERLSGLVDSLLDVSRLETGTFELVRADFDFAAMCRSLCVSLGAVLAPKKQRIEITIPDEPLWIHGDEARLSNVLANLVGNASKFSPDGTAVRVAVRRAHTSLHVTVTDEGYGISAEDRAGLFTPFFRGTNPDTLTAPGTGLGLVIARSIVRLHGGDLTLESELGHGATARFHVTGAMDGPSEAYRAEQAARERGAAPAAPEPHAYASPPSRPPA